ncbi:MAG: flagellar basal body P-ring protein FlgI [Myxococcota bacterium]|nr:flagellar basal body P-ring protein FlgI [Myxococcota bacterium]
MNLRAQILTFCAALTLCFSASFPGVSLAQSGTAHGERIKDIAHIRGVRKNQLFGYGLVVGLNRTGDSQQVRFAMQTVASLLARLNVRINPQGLLLRNVATVMVTADLPAFARNGTPVDVVISSMGDAKSLSGGTLIATALRGNDGQIYAIAQGPVSVGGYTSSGGGGNTKVVNHPTVARIAGGALVERELPFSLDERSQLVWQLFEDDFTTSVRLAQEINLNFGERLAQSKDSRTIEVQVPEGYRGDVSRFVSQVERIEVVPDTVAKVIINERTGTVIINQDVRVDPIAITHGNLTVSVTTTRTATPATPFTPGGTTTTRNSTLDVEEERRRLMPVNGGQNLSEIVDGLNRLGASPRDLITILQAIKKAGALRARLEII